MMTTLLGAVINLILDPVFIFLLGMGVQGAALATVLAQGVSAVWVLIFLLGRRSKLRLQTRYLRIRPSVLAPVVAIGVSPFIMQSTESLVNIALNASLKHYGSDLDVWGHDNMQQCYAGLFYALSWSGPGRTAYYRI